ncbi:hypothetical protein EVAR_67072_1 [Eumeta japonica]|uniref:Uncharacterized protein n=1 Tax=Eumeta variegata TaxID=151549 RepID=A0A4C1SBZ5_EUMVA|nr:hypothetical protein EVAR_67072_1 [Eumeta japonica]
MIDEFPNKRLVVCRLDSQCDVLTRVSSALIQIHQLEYFIWGKMRVSAYSSYSAWDTFADALVHVFAAVQPAA